MTSRLEHSCAWTSIRQISVRAEVERDAAAQRELGRIFAYGRGNGDGDYDVHPDKPKAIEWLGKAAAQGDAEAHFLMGECFDAHRLNFVDDPDIAIGCYRAAARQGHVEARLAIAELHLASRGESSCPVIGWKLLLQDAYLGVKAAQLRLAELLDADGRHLMSAAWRILAGETVRRPPKGAKEIAALLRQIGLFYVVANGGDDCTRRNINAWLRASFLP